MSPTPTRAATKMKRTKEDFVKYWVIVYSINAPPPSLDPWPSLKLFSLVEKWRSAASFPTFDHLKLFFGGKLKKWTSLINMVVETYAFIIYMRDMDLLQGLCTLAFLFWARQEFGCALVSTTYEVQANHHPTCALQGVLFLKLILLTFSYAFVSF